MPQAKTELFDSRLQDMSQLFKALGHPARIQILQYLANCQNCFCGDITEVIPLGRTTINQHLMELKRAGLIQGIVNGAKINYCLNPARIAVLNQMGIELFNELKKIKTTNCNTKEI
ncbi:MAG: helix-turn-helix transcriptional regulator [Marinilabiliaceae bacterium]|nr:helix-turn-helix transcriptional regulator [Marinilabiliaceae bacterium]